MTSRAMNNLEELLRFLSELEKRKISYRLEHNRAEALMVLVAVPGERLEIEFFADGNIEVETFGNSSGVKSTSTSEVLKRLEHH